MHLLVGIVQGKDPAESQSTLVHEAAHYEELPRRALGTSSFAGHTFTPGIKLGGGAVTRVDIVRKIASDHLQHAWDAASDAHMWLRGVRKVWLTKKDRAPFIAERTLILELSKLSDMTVHHQAAAHARITTLDITIIESVVRAMGIVGSLIDAEPLPGGPLSDKGAAEVMVAEATKKYGRLLHDPARDKALVDWLAAHFRTLPGPP